MKLLVREQGFDIAAFLFEEASDLFLASIGYVEARSALAGLARAGRLQGARRNRARVELEELWREANVVHFDARLVERAGDLSELHRLRAGDAIHLTTAVALAEPELVLVTWDRELARAAAEVGLAVAP